MEEKVSELYVPAFNRYDYCIDHSSYDTLITLRFDGTGEVKANIDVCCETYKALLIRKLTAFVGDLNSNA